MSTLLEEFRAIKRKYPDAIVLMRNEDEYFTFGQDAETLERTCFFKGKFRSSDIDFALLRLVKAGYRVAIADPLQ